MFDDCDRLATSPAHAVALDCLAAGVRGADPQTATNAALTVEDDRLTLAGSGGETTLTRSAFDRVLVLGGGKAAPGVVRALHGALGSSITDGIVVVPAESPDAGTDIGCVELAPGGHPVPTAEGVVATRRILELAHEADERTLVLAVVTGGGSALLTAPAGDLTIEDLQHVTRSLLDAGADITAVNTVRKQLSDVKGGRLAAACGPATALGVVVSDVVGDSLPVIASGPTVPDTTTPAEALDVLDRYGVDAPAVRTHLERTTVAAEGVSTPRERSESGSSAFSGVSNHIVASNRTAVEAAAAAAAERGYEPCLLSTRVRGEAAAAAPTHAAIAAEVAASGNPVEPPAVLLSGGETTVDTSTAADPGVGGPNTEFALASALELDAENGIVVGALDTDGFDGSTDAAGALVDAGTVREDATAREALSCHDSLSFLDARDAVLRTGATGTNVDDLRLLVVPGQ